MEKNNELDFYVKEFISFLKDKHAYKEYKINLRNRITRSNKTLAHQSIAHKMFLKTHIFPFPMNIGSARDIMKNIISSSFVWGETKEGHRFWRDISVEWGKNDIFNP